MIFLTGQLWQWMRFPLYQHPIFQYARREAITNNNIRRWQQILLLFLAVLLVALVVLVPQLIFLILLAIVLGIPTVMVLFNGTLLGTVWVSGIVSSLSSEKHSNMLDLLRLSPIGGIGAAWLLSVAVVHRHNWLRRVYKIIKWLVLVIMTLIMLAIVALIIGMVTTSNEQLQQTQLNVLHDAIILGALVIMFWLDHIQSIVIAMVLGLALSSPSGNLGVYRGIAPVIYIVLQVLTYLAVMMVSILCHIILQSLIGTPFLVSILTLGFSCVSFILLREMITGILLHFTLKGYDLTINEFQEVMNIVN